MKTRGIGPQMDLFVSFLQDVHLRDQQDLMERPFFSLSKNKRLKKIEYRSPNGKIWVKVNPHQDYGMATIWDADILIWAASVLNRYKKQGINDPPRTLKVPCYELLTAIGRDPGGHNIELLDGAIKRLKSTIIETNIRPPDGDEKAIFSWIDSASSKVQRPLKTKNAKGALPTHLSISVSEWFYKSVLEDKALLSIDLAYFGIKGGRERWLYRVARKHAGGNGAAGFPLDFPTLFEKSGAEGTYRRFKFEMLKIVERDELPGYALSLEYSGPEPTVRMIRRDQSEPQATEQTAASVRSTRPHLTDDTLAAARRACPGKDIYALKADFDNWLDGAGRSAPDNYQGAFLAYAGKAAGRSQNQQPA
jgi:plasmid replication initiation protein